MSGLEDHPSQTYAVDTLAVHVTSWHSTKIHIYTARAAGESKFCKRISAKIQLHARARTA